jgi:aspartate dehydrogenase
MNETILQEVLETGKGKSAYPKSNADNLTDDLIHNVMIVGILGCGAIANIITDFVMAGKLNIDLKFFYDLNMEKAENLASQVDGVVVDDVNDMLDHVDLVIEAASPQAVVEIVPQILKKGKDVIIMSLGALIDPEFRANLEKIARKNNSQIYAPSGAIAGLDGIKAASIGEIHKVSLITRKSPESLGISADDETILYEGKAGDAVRKFPMNINVAAALSIAFGREADVKIIADPAVDQNCHEIYVVGDFGELRTITQNNKCTTNPKTSILAAYSAIKLLKSLNDNIKIGT